MRTQVRLLGSALIGRGSNHKMFHLQNYESNVSHNLNFDIGGCTPPLMLGGFTHIFVCDTTPFFDNLKHAQPTRQVGSKETKQ